MTADQLIKWSAVAVVVAVAAIAAVVSYSHALALGGGAWGVRRPNGHAAGVKTGAGRPGRKDHDRR